MALGSLDTITSELEISKSAMVICVLPSALLNSVPPRKRARARKAEKASIGWRVCSTGESMVRLQLDDRKWAKIQIHPNPIGHPPLPLPLSGTGTGTFTGAEQLGTRPDAEGCDVTRRVA